MKLCTLGIHIYNAPTFFDQYSSSVREYKQRCKKCNHIIRWIQPKGTNYRYYPAYWTKRLTAVHFLGLIFLLLGIAILVIFLL